MKINIKKILLEDRGQGLMEYSLIFAFIGLIVISVLQILGIQIFDYLSSLINSGF